MSSHGYSGESSMFRISSQQSCSLTSTFLFIPDTVCHRLVRFLDDGGRLFRNEEMFLNPPLLQLTCPGTPDSYCTPDFADGSRLTLDLSVAGQITVTAYGGGMASCNKILTPAHPMWGWISNGPGHMELLRKWQEWAATPAPGEQRAVALERVTTCMNLGEKGLYLICLGLTSLPDLPPWLEELQVDQNQLTHLPDLPNSLTTLYARNNALTHLPDLPHSLTTLYAGSNQLTNLPDLHEPLTTLYVSKNRLTSLPDVPSSLTILYAGNNQLTRLPEQLHSLIKLSVERNQLTDLPELPRTLLELDVSKNRLTDLPELPNSLARLDIWSNQLIGLPNLPSSLKMLAAGNNPLTSLPPLPLSLRELYARNTALTCLPDLPDSLRVLHVRNAPLTTLPPLPASLYERDVSFRSQRTVCSTLATAGPRGAPKE